VEPEDNVGYTKRRHLSRAARCYIAAEDDPGMNYRFDIVSVHAPEHGKPSVRIIRDAFPGE